MKKNYKIIAVLGLVLIFLSLFSPRISALEQNVDSYKDEFDYEKITENIDSETLNILEEMGIDEITFEKIYSVKPQKVLDTLWSVTTDAFKEPLRFLTAAMGILIITALVESFCGDNRLISLLGSCVLVLSIAVPVTNSVTSAFSVLEMLSAFTVGFAGAFCALVSASGNIALGTSYASLAVMSDTVFSGLLGAVSKPAVNLMCSLSFLSCFDVYELSPKISALVKRMYISFLGFVATLFSGIVTLKGVLGAGADTVTSRGVKFVVGRSLPIVGGAISETYSTLVAGLSLIRNTVGIFGIVTVVLAVLPSLMQMCGWILTLSAVSILSDFLGSGKTGGMLSVLKDALILLCVTLIFSGVIFVVSVGVVIFVKGV